VFLAFALAAHGFNAAWGKIKEISRLYLAWIIPFSLYVVYIIAVKPDHYWMPVMLPLFASVIPLVENLWSEYKNFQKSNPDKAMLCLAGALITLIVLITQVVFNLGTSWGVIANVL
ncbi:MAG TPA: hypothetical protein VF338_02275, partial [Leptolinea sp.]